MRIQQGPCCSGLRRNVDVEQQLRAGKLCPDCIQFSEPEIEDYYRRRAPERSYGRCAWDLEKTASNFGNIYGLWGSPETIRKIILAKNVFDAGIAAYKAALAAFKDFCGG